MTSPPVLAPSKEPFINKFEGDNTISSFEPWITQFFGKAFPSISATLPSWCGLAHNAYFVIYFASGNSNDNQVFIPYFGPHVVLWVCHPKSSSNDALLKALYGGERKTGG